jgi:hypothetical protein
VDQHGVTGLRWLAGVRPEESVVRAARESLRPLLLDYDDEQAQHTAITGFPPFSRPRRRP